MGDQLLPHRRTIYQRAHERGEIDIDRIPDAVLAAIDAHAARLGLSRTEYLRRRLAQDADAAEPVTVAQLRAFGETFEDLGDQSVMSGEYLTPLIEDRALEVQGLLADQGKHRAPSIPDLLIASCAERAGLTVLHLDKDFDLIAMVTGQPVERVRV